MLDARAVLDILAVLATWLAAFAAGAAMLRPLRRALGSDNAGSEIALVEELVAGLLLLHALLQTLDLAGIEWHPLLLAAAALGAGIAFFAVRRRWPVAPSRAGRVPGPGDLAAAVAVGGFALACFFLRSPFSDFVYHWGLKGQRFYLARGTDYELLGAAANGYLHPDYPNLVPELFAVPAILAGRFFEPALLLGSAGFLVLVALTTRAELRRAHAPRLERELGLAAVALGTAAFCIGYYQAGGADLPFAAAVLLGVSALREPSASSAALRAGLAAALAAALKIEGPPFAAILVALFVLGRARDVVRRPALLALLAAAPAVVVGSWTYQLARHDLYQPTNSAGIASIDGDRLATIAERSWQVVLLDAWHGLPLLLLALPLLLVPARSRLPAALCLLQLGFYLYVYASAPLEPGFFVLSSLPRLLLHVWPAAAVVAVIALAGAPDARESTAAEPAFAVAGTG